MKKIILEKALKDSFSFSESLSESSFSQSESLSEGIFPPHSTCYGCRNGILNQLGHMEKGGCLYVSSESVEEQESKKSCRPRREIKRKNCSCCK